MQLHYFIICKPAHVSNIPSVIPHYSILFITSFHHPNKHAIEILLKTVEFWHKSWWSHDDMTNQINWTYIHSIFLWMHPVNGKQTSKSEQFCYQSVKTNLHSTVHCKWISDTQSNIMRQLVAHQWLCYLLDHSLSLQSTKIMTPAKHVVIARMR